MPGEPSTLSFPWSMAPARRLATSGKRCPGSNPTATRIGSSPIPPSGGPLLLRANSLRPGAGGRSGCPDPDGSARCPSPRASRWRWRCTKSRNGARSKANWRSWSERGAKPRRSPRSPTTCSFPSTPTSSWTATHLGDGPTSLPERLEAHSSASAGPRPPSASPTSSHPLPPNPVTLNRAKRASRKTGCAIPVTSRGDSKPQDVITGSFFTYRAHVRARNGTARATSRHTYVSQGQREPTLLSSPNLLGNP